MRTMEHSAEARAAAMAAIQAHGERNILELEDIHPGDMAELLTDLRHVADLRGFDIQHLLNLSAVTYEHQRSAPRLW